MLKEEQIAELIRRHRDILGQNIARIKGNLRKAENRSAQIWELIVLDVVSRIGKVEYESCLGQSPDIKLICANSRPIWIEVAYLYPRFWQENRKIRATMDWIFKEAKRKGIPPYKIFPSLHAEKKTDAGPKPILPDLNEKKVFLNNNNLQDFFNHVLSNPHQNYKSSLSHYSIVVEYMPHAKGPYLSYSGLLLETPQVVEEHAVYRVLRKKAKQHDLDAPRIVCVGSDVNNVLSNTHALHSAINIIFKERSSLTAVITVQIKSEASVLGLYEKVAKAEITINPHAKNRLTPEEQSLLKKMNFNHWKYTWSLPRYKIPNESTDSTMSGKLVCREGKYGPIIEIPTKIIIDALVGKTTLDKEYKLSDEDYIWKMLKQGCTIKSCSFKEADLEAGEASKVVLELSPMPSLFNPPKKIPGNPKDHQ